MKYLGGKAKIAKYLIPFISAARQTDQWYVEPFVGGANTICHMGNPRIGNDIHYYLIELLKAVQSGWIPPEKITRKQYKDIKDNKELYSPELVGFVGFPCSFAAKWFGGYASNKTKRNYAREDSNWFVKHKKSLEGIIFTNQDYRELNIPEKSLIYCDPPYASTTQYKDSFDSELFWEWCRERKKEGHILFVSEYNAPDDFECILSIPTQSSVNHTTDKHRIEKLFRL